MCDTTFVAGDNPEWHGSDGQDCREGGSKKRMSQQLETYMTVFVVIFL